MGLITQAISRNSLSVSSVGQSKKKNGLLGRIEYKSPYDCVYRAFLDVLLNARCEKGFLLFPVDEYYRVLFQHGFDFTSCARMMPEIPVLSEMCHDSLSMSTFSGSQLKLFASYFSTRERASLDSVVLYRIDLSDQVVWLLLAQSRLSMGRGSLDLDTITIEHLGKTLSSNMSLVSALSVRDIPAGHSAAEQEKMSLAFDESRAALLLSVSFERLFPDPVIVETDYNQNVLYRSLANKIIRQAGPASIVRRADDYSLRFVIFAAPGTDSALYLHQMKKTLDKHFGVSRVARLSFSCEGTAQNEQCVWKFLDGVQ